jgi:hypothetical protein
MAFLENNDIDTIWGDYMSRETESGFSLTKQELRAAVTALDQFLENNRTTINNAIPLPARTALTTRQKILILKYVLDKRLVRGVDV